MAVFGFMAYMNPVNGFREYCTMAHVTQQPYYSIFSFLPLDHTLCVCLYTYKYIYVYIYNTNLFCLAS